MKNDFVFDLSEGCDIRNPRLQSNLLMWPPVLRDHLSQAATFSGSLEPKYSVNEAVLRGHLSEAVNFYLPYW